MVGERVTFSDLMQLSTPVITGSQAAEAMGMSPTRLLGYAKEKPELIPFPYQLSGNSMKVPRIPFLKFWGCISENNQDEILKELIGIREQITALNRRLNGGEA